MLRLVPTPIGNIQDITLRAIEALKSAQILLCEDTRVTKKLINLLNLDIKTSKIKSVHKYNINEFLSKIDPSFFEKDVVYVSDAGMPGISDPGVELIRYCQKNSIEYDVFPGASAFVTAFVASGFEGEFSFFGFLPHSGKKREERLEQILNHHLTSIIYEAPHRLLKLLDEIYKIDEKRELFLAKELTKMHQTFFRGSAKTLLEILNEEKVRGEWVVVISASSEVKKESLITKSDILKLNIPKKDKAKLLAKLTDRPIKDCYNELIKN